MGTRNLLTVTDAATLAGDSNNQDRYAYEDTWAFVLDGATSRGEQPIHDGGWYTQRLMDALSDLLISFPATGTVHLVAEAIRRASSAHHPDKGPCPESTIALARWDEHEVEL